MHTVYAHLSKITVNVGDTVKQGQSLGVCGQTGFAHIKNLHFGLYVFGVPVSPYVPFENGVTLTDPITIPENQ